MAVRGCHGASLQQPIHQRIRKSAAAAIRLRPEQLAVQGYWQTILPGSKRLLAHGKIFGDNTDVRAPRGDEVWRGGGIGSSGGGRASSDTSRVRNVVLVIDGAFFVDGEFVGPNEMRLWEDVYHDGEVKIEAARMAGAGKRSGRSAAEIMVDIDRYIGPPPAPGVVLPPMARRETVEPEDFRRWHRGQLATSFSFLRRQGGDEAVVNKLVSWLDTPLPKLRRS